MATPFFLLFFFGFRLSPAFSLPIPERKSDAFRLENAPSPSIVRIGWNADIILTDFAYRLAGSSEWTQIINIVTNYYDFPKAKACDTYEFKLSGTDLTGQIVQATLLASPLLPDVKDVKQAFQVAYKYDTDAQTIKSILSWTTPSLTAWSSNDIHVEYIFVPVVGLRGLATTVETLNGTAVTMTFSAETAEAVRKGDDVTYAFALKQLSVCGQPLLTLQALQADSAFFSDSIRCSNVNEMDCSNTPTVALITSYCAPNKVVTKPSDSQKNAVQIEWQFPNDLVFTARPVKKYVVRYGSVDDASKLLFYQTVSQIGQLEVAADAHEAIVSTEGLSRDVHYRVEVCALFDDNAVLGSMSPFGFNMDIFGTDNGKSQRRLNVGSLFA